MRIVTDGIHGAALLLGTLAVTSLLAGCVPVDPESLRTDPGRSYSFSTKTDYEVAYNNISAGFLRCLTGASFRMTFAIRPRIDRTNKTASIVFVHHGAWTDYWALVDIASVADGTTVKVNTNSFSALGDLGSTAERWTNGSQHCPDVKHLTSQFPLQE
jgi:hypothetical protein